MPIIDEIRAHRDMLPFQAFLLRTADGREYPVPAREYIWLPPGGRRMFVADRKGITAPLSPSSIVEIVLVSAGD